MNTNYLETTLTKAREFRTDFKCQLNGISSTFRYIKHQRRAGIKIDTGAQGTLIPLRTLGWTSSQIDKLINKYLYYGRTAFSVIHGVETTNMISDYDLQLMTDDQIRKFQGLAIRLKADYLKIGGYEIFDKEIRVTTQTTGNILLGMNIMKDWDIHIGKDNKTNEIIFLACPIEKINQDYLLALEEHFGLGTTISAAIVNDNIRNNRV